MIARVWRGRTSPRPDAFEAFLHTTPFPALSTGVPGFRGGYVLRRDASGEDELVVMTLFDSLETVRAFARDEHEVPVSEPDAARLLRRATLAPFITRR